MSSIDERIVKMTFDNSDFEGKISKTLQSLEKLNETLSKTTATDGLKEVTKALKEVQAQVSGMDFKTEDIIDIDESETKLQKFGNFLLNVRDKAKKQARAGLFFYRATAFTFLIKIFLCEAFSK